MFDDDVCNRIVEKLNEADALIVGSPVYYGQPNGAVMAVLQRAFFSGANVQNKPAAAVAICRRGGATAAYQTMNMLFEMKNMPVVTSQYWNIAYGMAPGEATQDTEGMQTMRTLADNMAWNRSEKAIFLTCFIYDNPGFQVITRSTNYEEVKETVEANVAKGVQTWQANFKITPAEVTLEKYFQLAL